MRLKLRPYRRGISWTEAAVLLVVVVAAFCVIEFAFDDPAALILSLLVMAVLLVGLRLMANRPPP